MNVLNTTAKAVKMFDAIARRFENLFKALNQRSKVKIVGQLTELRIPSKLSKVKLTGKLSDMKLPNKFSKVKIKGQLIQLKIPNKFLKVKLKGQLTELKVPSKLSKVKLMGQLTDLKVPTKLTKIKLSGQLSALKQSNKATNSATAKKTGGKGTNKATDAAEKKGLKLPGFVNLQNAKSLISSTMGAGMKQQQTKGAFIARAGNTQLGSAIYDQVAKQAMQYGQNTDTALSSAMNFTPATLDPKKLTDLNKLAMRLAQMNPEKGLEGAAASMMGLFKGDSASMVEDFGMGNKTVESSTALKAAKAGDVNGFIKGMDELLNKRNMTEKAFDNMMKSPSAQWQSAINSFKFNLGLAGQMGLEAFGPLITMITEAFNSGKFTPFFSMLGKGLYAAVTAVTWLAQGFMGMIDYLSANLPKITGFILAGLVVALWMVVAPLLSQAAAWFLTNLPILLAIGAVALFIFDIQQMGVSTEQIVGAIVGIFYSLFALLKNFIVMLWNIFVSFKEFLLNVFKDPVYATKKLFLDLGKSIAGFLDSAINGAVEGLNFLIDAINKIPGVSVPLIPEVNLTKWLDQIELTSDKDVVDLSNEKMKYEDLGEAFNTGFNKGEGLMDSMKSMKNPFNLDTKYEGPITAVDKINKVGEVGSVKDTVEVSGEDLATMRELAEMKNIQNFVQMTPSVNVQTGDIRQESDINSIVARIEQELTEQIVSSAQGVYGT